MRKTYATHLTKDYLEFLGVTDVTEDGRIFTKDGELKPYPRKDGYMQVALYSPVLRQAIAPEDRNSASGQECICVHRIVYVWYNKIQPDGYVIHHLNKIKDDNRLCNLALETPGGNIWADRVCNVKEVKCKLNKPRSFYEEKIAKYESLYQKAKDEHNSVEAHNLRSALSLARAYLRYYDSHIEEANKAVQSFKDLEMIKYLAKEAKKDGDKVRWHQLNTIVKNWKSFDEELKEKLITAILRGPFYEELK